MERPGVPGHLWVLLLIPIALWLTPPVSGLTSTKSVSPTTTVTKLSSSLSSTITTTMTSSKTTATSTTIPTTPTTPTTTTTTLSTTAAPVVPGKDCDKEKHSPPCVSNAFCNDTKMCQCNSTHYEDASYNTCRERKPYAGECSQSSECQTVNNQDCVPDDKNQKRCLCMQDYFRLTECKNKNILTITPSRPGQAQENSINVTWTNPTDPNGASLEYKATSTDPSGTIVHSLWSSDPHYYFMNLTQGTVYIISVTAKTQSNPSYGNGTVEHKGPDVNIYTKPAQPGSLSSANFNSVGGNVTVEFTASAGRVERYTVIVTKDGTTTNASSATVAMSKVSAFFVGLTPGEHYNVTMTAFSGNIPSKSRTGRFRVNAQPAGKVSGGKLISNGSRWVQISWTKPSKPNGEIMGYTVQVRSDNGSCSSGIAVRCDACNYNSTMVTPEVNECNRKDQIIEPISNLGSNSYVVSVNVTDLKPYTNYTYTIVAYNEEGAGMPFSGHTFVTLSEAAANLKNLAITAPSKGVLSISLKPGERRGKTTYIITLEEEESIDRGDYKFLNVTVLEGYENTSTDIDNLLSYWKYRVTVATYTTIGFSPDNTTEDARTRESEPGQVQTLQLTPDENDASKLVLKFECPKEKERNGNIVKFIYNSSADKSEFTTPREPKGDLTWNNDCVFNRDLVVSAETEYTINVYAVTEGNLNGSVSTQTVNISATPPTLTPPTGRKLVEQKGITQREVALEVCPCLVSKEQGTITLAGIIVCVTTNDDDCNKRRSLQGSRVGDASMYKDRQEFPTWKEFKDSGYTGKYRATPDNWHTIIGEGGTRRRRRSLLKRVARTADDFLRYTLGDNSSCEQAKPDVYCNGPLPAGREIKILVFACTRGGCSEVLALEDLRTEAFADDDNTEAIVGGIVAALAVIALVVVAVFMFRRGHDGHSPLKPHAPRVIPKPIKLKDFTAHLNRLNKDSNLLFQEEFEDVQENSPKQYSHEAATLDVNKIKNRYVNILPYDHTRVKLITDDDDDSSDFINANYIPGYTSPREYIATQGPMTGTIADFWRMMWEQKSSLVVMLSDLQEKGRPKVDMYWPGEMNSPVQYGDIVVELTSDSTLNKYTIRTFKLYVENNPDDSRRVTQYFIPGWEDYSANLSPDDVLDFIGSVRQAARSGQGQGPVCVHCSAGVGRTGTFIALDFLMQFVTEHSLDDEVDIYNLVLNMRHNRPYMVQSEKQYVFIHDTLKLIIDRKIKEMQAQDEHVYGNTQPEDNIYANQAFDPDENLYENTTSMSDKLTTSL